MTPIRERRAARWDAGFLPCKRHPARRITRSTFIVGGHYRCGACNHRRADGSFRPHVQRRITTGNNKWSLREHRSTQRIDEARF